MSYNPFGGCSSTCSAIAEPATKDAAEELRRQILDLPAGFLAQLYVDLYATGLRIATAEVEGKKWLKGLGA